jgi:hypothetical protein
MATKTWKLGELCQGGVITVETSAKKVKVIAKEWDVSQGHSRGSNQANAKEFNRIEVDTENRNAYSKLNEFLNELTTSYWAGEVMVWIQSKSKLDKNFDW